MTSTSKGTRREELERAIAAMEEELQERRAALPVHSVRPAQFAAIEELEEEIEVKKEELKSLGR